MKNKTNPIQQPTIAGSPEDDFIFTTKQHLAKAQASASITIPTNFKGPAYEHTLTDFTAIEADHSTKSSGAKLFVLSIGISNYFNLIKLSYTRKDAEDVAESLTNQAGFFYDSVVTYILTDEKATKRSIMRSIYNIKTKVRPGDMIMMYFSGHIRQAKQSGTYYFIPIDGDIDNMETNSIDYENIRSFLGDAPCKSILFLSGVYETGIGSPTEDLKSIENGVAVLTATNPGGLQLESHVWENGLFAQALMDGISGFADTDSSGYVNLDELSIYINRRIYKEAKGMQYPNFFIPEVLLKFKISKAIKREEDPVLKQTGR